MPKSPTSPQILKVRVGESDATTPYQAEQTGFKLAVANPKAKPPRLTDFFWFLTDNQTVIRDLTEFHKTKPRMAA